MQFPKVMSIDQVRLKIVKYNLERALSNVFVQNLYAVHLSSSPQKSLYIYERILLAGAPNGLFR